MRKPIKCTSLPERGDGQTFGFCTIRVNGLFLCRVRITSATANLDPPVDQMHANIEMADRNDTFDYISSTLQIECNNNISQMPAMLENVMSSDQIRMK